MKLRRFLHDLYKRLWLHRISTLVGMCLLAFVFMLWQKIITTTDFALAVGTIISFYVALSKDDNKVATKEKYQVPDPPDDNPTE